MATRIRIELNKEGIREAALNSPEIEAAVVDIAERIAGRARGVTRDEIKVETQRRRDRIGARVTRADASGEAEDRALGRSIGGL